MNGTPILGGLAALLLAFAGPATAGPRGPDPMTVDQTGKRLRFGEVIGGQVTVLHFMFPSCQSFCPLSGAMLARTQQLLDKQRPAKDYKIVSVSIVPRETTPKRLTDWLRTHRAQAGWVALYVGPQDLGPLMRYYGETATDVQLHSSQMLVLDAQGRLVKRFDDIPTPDRLAQVIRIAAR